MLRLYFSRSELDNLRSSRDPMLPSQMRIINILIFGQFFEGFNFTDLSNPQNSWNLNTSNVWYPTVYGYMSI